jgi:hypothetical protein
MKNPGEIIPGPSDLGAFLSPLPSRKSEQELNILVLEVTLFFFFGGGQK